MTYRFFCFLQPLTVRDPGDRKRNKENQRELALARQLELVITIFILKAIIFMSHQQKDTADFSYEKKTMQFLEYFVKVSQCCYYGQYIRCPKAIVGLLTQIASCVLGPLFMKFRVAFFYSLLGENILVNYL